MTDPIIALKSAFIIEMHDKLVPHMPEVPDQHWLESDASISYCRPCAREARWKELPSFGPVPKEKPFYEVSEYDLQDLINEGIDGGCHYSGMSDGSSNCHTCGDQLKYTLTDYGVEEEADHFLENPLTESDANNELAIYQIVKVLEKYPDFNDESIIIKQFQIANQVHKILPSIKLLQAPETGQQT